MKNENPRSNKRQAPQLMTAMQCLPSMSNKNVYPLPYHHEIKSVNYFLPDMGLWEIGLFCSQQWTCRAAEGILRGAVPSSFWIRVQRPPKTPARSTCSGR